jgi:hypothetical protein
MPDTSNARRPRRRLAYLLAPLVLAGSLAVGGIAEAATFSPAQAAASSPARAAASTSAGAVNFGSDQADASSHSSYPPMYGCSYVHGWSSKIFSHRGTEFWGHPGCNSLSIVWVAKTGWYQGFYKTMGPWGKWLPCGKPMNLWMHSGWALLCKWVPPCSKLRVLSLQGHIAPITVKV